MTERYLWSPLRIGPVTVKNRIVFSAHLTNYAEGGRPTEQHAAYYAERAKGGAGLIIAGGGGAGRVTTGGGDVTTGAGPLGLDTTGGGGGGRRRCGCDGSDVG